MKLTLFLGLGLGLILILALHTNRPAQTANIPAALPSPTTTPAVVPAEVQQLPATIYETARSQPVEALVVAMEKAPATPAGDDLITYTAVQWAATDPQGAALWAEQVTDISLRRQLLTAIATTWSESDALAAAELALRTIPAGRQQEDAVVGIVQRWVQQQPESAAAWVLEFPAGTLRATALENVVKIWVEQDFAEATRWLAGLEAGASRDTAVAVYVTEIAAVQPELAAQWADSIEDVDLRSQQLAALAANVN